MIDYSIFYRIQLPINQDWPDDSKWDVFISAFNSSDRVKTVFHKATAVNKHWLVFDDYKYEAHEYPSGTVYAFTNNNEAECILKYIEGSNLKQDSIRICIDITGFIKPYAMFLIKCLADMGVKKLDVIYSEPQYYKRKEETQFSDEQVREVRQVAGFEGIHVLNTAEDLLITNVGYDHELIMQTAVFKDNARKIQIFGFPPLRPDMYQGNVLRVERAAETVGIHAGDHPHNYFAPANDPFVTADVLSKIVKEQKGKGRVRNIYLCPLATEAQALGFTLFYLRECRNEAVSMIYPFCFSYPRSTSIGISRIWQYTVEF
ncbi:hypothetical protein D4S03_06830 [bacterium]|nr:MAG: hypothetical protein D4S03_06830 [bacterium]